MWHAQGTAKAASCLGAAPPPSQSQPSLPAPLQVKPRSPPGLARGELRHLAAQQPQQLVAPQLAVSPVGVPPEKSAHLRLQPPHGFQH